MKISKLQKYERLPNSIDYPRDEHGTPTAMIHESFLGRDFIPLENGLPIFTSYSGKTIRFGDEGYFPQRLLDEINSGREIVPFFIGESAYVEKGIAFITGIPVN